MLNIHWDPIGVAGDLVDDEYDSYISVIYSMLTRDASPEDLAEHLLRIETDSMGLSGLPRGQRLKVARLLRRLELPPLS